MSSTPYSPELVKAIKQFYFLGITHTNPDPIRIFRVKDNDKFFLLTFRQNHEIMVFTAETLAAWNQRQGRQNQYPLTTEQFTFYCTVDMEGFKENPVVTEELVYKLADAMDYQEAVNYLISEFPSVDNTVESALQMYMLVQYTEAGGDLKIVNHTAEEAEFLHCWHDIDKKVSFRFLTAQEIRETMNYACYLPLTFEGPFFEDLEFKAAVFEKKKVPVYGDVMKRLSTHVFLNDSINHFIDERDDCMGSNFLFGHN